MAFPRESGVVLHITSLPGPYGIGEVGKDAAEFAAALQEMGQSIWQVLPLGPTSYGDSPYQSLSSFAGNQLLISLDSLVEDGILDKKALADYPTFDPHVIDYGPIIRLRNKLLAQVAKDFDDRANVQMKLDFDQFTQRNSDWLEDFALFMALKNHHHGKSWTQWAPELVTREPKALDQARVELASAIHVVRVLQFLFDRQWRQLRQICKQHHVKLLGDIPIFVAHDSADVWANPELFYLDEKGNPTVIAGVPPDYFSETGQRWGNPLFRWDVHQRDGYAWWKRRLARTLETVDLVRLDHFRGFDEYWEIPADEETAVNGNWIKGPGLDLFKAFQDQFGELPIIAEDLGLITETVEKLLEDTGFPGMKILQFMFGETPMPEENNPQKFPENSVCYTAAHDNDTTIGWFKSLKAGPDTPNPQEFEQERRTVMNFFQSSGAEINWTLLNAAWNSKSNTALAILQDVLGLDSDARLNFPGKPEGNWQWRFSWDQLDDSLKRRMRALTESSGRLQSSTAKGN